MKILFDHQIFSSQRFGGVSRYHVELIKNLKAKWQIPLLFSNNAYLKEIMPATGFFPDWNFRGKDRLLEYLNRFDAISALRTGTFDVFHPTFYHSYCLNYLKSHPMVLTVHDMIHDVYRDLPSSAWEVREKHRMCAAAKMIITPSEFTANELMRLYGIPVERIRVVPHGAPTKTAWGNPDNPGRFLFVGHRGFYKNFGIVLRAMRQVPDARLLCVGAPFTIAEQEMIAGLGLKERVDSRRVDDDAALSRLYAGSAALIFPSECEGFGLPVLEAFAAGCPAILSDIPVFREVGGNAAVYFKPDSAAELADRIRRLMATRETSGIERQLSKFSWARCAEETMAVYGDALK